MLEIKFTCDWLSTKRDHKLGVYLQAWFLKQLDHEVSTSLHEPSSNPYAICVDFDREFVEFKIKLLTEDFARIAEVALLREELKEIVLTSSEQKVFKIISVACNQCDQNDLKDLFYSQSHTNEFLITFKSATSFKVSGDYAFVPDLRLLFQSMLTKYALVFENTPSIDREMLDDLVKLAKIVNFRIQSSYYPVHRSFIPGFVGQIKIRCHGNKTLINYLHMLLRFSEYAGVGVKTSMGMGAIELTPVKKGETNG